MQHADGRFFEKKEVFVVGAGYSACQESIFLAQFASKVNLIVRKMNFPVVEQLLKN